MRLVDINWTRCNSYQNTINFYGCVYLHEWIGKPFYWGKVDKSVFGGNQRIIGGRRRSARYGPSYRHWIEGCLQHGGRLYIGKVSPNDSITIEQVEMELLRSYPPEIEQKLKEVPRINLQHHGELPLCIAASEKD